MTVESEKTEETIRDLENILSQAERTVGATKDVTRIAIDKVLETESALTICQQYFGNMAQTLHTMIKEGKTEEVERINDQILIWFVKQEETGTPIFTLNNFHRQFVYKAVEGNPESRTLYEGFLQHALSKPTDEIVAKSPAAIAIWECKMNAANLKRRYAVKEENDDKLQEAHDECEACQQFWQEIGDKDRESSAIYELGMIAETREQWEEAEKWHRKSAELAKNTVMQTASLASAEMVRAKYDPDATPSILALLTEYGDGLQDESGDDARCWREINIPWNMAEIAQENKDIETELQQRKIIRMNAEEALEKGWLTTQQQAENEARIAELSTN